LREEVVVLRWPGRRRVRHDVRTSSRMVEATS
jgi:hypothetical protein